MSELMLDVGQANELKLAFRRHNFTNDDIKKLCEGDVLARVLHLVRGMGVETISPPDFTVSVDRMVKPAYPDWVKKVMHSGMEGVGPAEYDLKSDVEEWLHPDQKNGVVSGNAIYAFLFLREGNALADCLSLADLLAIQKKGIAVFHELFKGKAIFGWKSVVQDRGGDLSVPCLCERGDEVVLYWGWLYDDWNSFSPAVRFRK